MNNRKIPIVFAFDDNYALPASIAIKSLLDSKRLTTQYEIIVFHSGLNPKTIRKMEKITPIKWIRVDKKSLPDIPVGWSGLETWYRLLMADLLPEYDRVIWSDVDVLFRHDLSDIFNMDMNGADWAGVAAERADEKNGIHAHFTENKKPFIYMPGFMIADTKLWRDKNIFSKFVKVIKKYGKKLKMFDLDTLNLAADKIAPVPFEYCVLENIYDNENIENSPEYPWLARVHGHGALLAAKQNPVIIHYAGKWPKIWNRPKNEIPEYYMRYIKQSPFKKRKSYFAKLLRKTRNSLRRLWRHIKWW
ncbi:MAG: glycosyltransferase family 8 protein [Rickettsiales bacterium]|jgi:lipopolysaccharide biosynthesis glycosyltransferase|nr:glycosyltransferase family 8 protein [Rickettsiales bacterium]